jgi:hypothetical protein
MADLSWLSVVVVSDRGDLYLPDCLDNLTTVLPEAEVLLVNDEDHKLGMAGAVRRGMEMALETGCEFVLWVEEDFRFLDRPPVRDMAIILDFYPHLAQVVLKRQPWSGEEHAAGGIVEMAPSDYSDQSFMGISWLEHKRIFSMNPCLIPRNILEFGYPDSNEAGQTERLVAAGFSFAFYGKRDDPPLVHHVGHERGSGWKL